MVYLHEPLDRGEPPMPRVIGIGAGNKLSSHMRLVARNP